MEESGNSISQLSWSLLQDSFHTTLCLHFRPSHIAVAMIFFSLKCLGITVPTQGAQNTWWKVSTSWLFSKYSHSWKQKEIWLLLTNCVLIGWQQSDMYDLIYRHLQTMNNSDLDRGLCHLAKLKGWGPIKIFSFENKYFYFPLLKVLSTNDTFVFECASFSVWTSENASGLKCICVWTGEKFWKRWRCFVRFSVNSRRK